MRKLMKIPLNVGYIEKLQVIILIAKHEKYGSLSDGNKFV